MDANLTMQNNLSEEEPAAYFQRVYKLNRLDASKNEHTYMKLIECGGKLSMDDYMELVGRQKPNARTEPALHKNIVSNPVNCVLCGEPLTDSERLNDGNCCDLCWLSN